MRSIINLFYIIIYKKYHIQEDFFAITFDNVLVKQMARFLWISVRLCSIVVVGNTDHFLFIKSC